MRLFAAALLCLAGAAHAQEARRHMVVAPHPLASEAGLAMLRAGGSALDAAIAAQAVMTLVEPQSSGIGGGAFLLHHDPADGTVAWDGREVAPAAARGDLFIVNGQPMAFPTAVVGGRSVGVPGVMRMLAAAHREHGRIEWAALFQPAIRLSEEGFSVSRRLAAAISASAEALRRDPVLGAIYTPGGIPLAEGATLRNQTLATTLRAIAEQGADALHRGPVAAEIARVVRSHPNAGLLTADDLAGYAPRRATALCRPYRIWVVCVPPPPSGGLAVLQILGLLEHLDMPRIPPAGAEAALLLGDAGRLAFADRNRFLADPMEIPVPVAGLLDPSYLLLRAQALDAARAIAQPRAGNPRLAPAPAPDAQRETPGGTAQVSVVDAQGRAVSMTTTVEGPFGAHIGVGGFVLNNQLTDFSFRPEIDGLPVANRVAGGKRPRSSMSPAMVFDAQGQLLAVTGSPGGARIIGYVAQSLVALLDWGMDAQAAAALPHVGPFNEFIELEESTGAAAHGPALEARGATLRVLPMPSGLNLIRIRRQGESVLLQGGADPRREGVALGE
ncbi:MAG: gamma-glutamyltransferase family protein [Alphaproteobacteria bacterium]|nr:gamma-glutamyltransferase family protein [Alphaproteobacteria bacterium]